MLGARIAALRQQAGFSQAELAKKLQISASAVGMYEQGRREPAGELLVSIASVFGVTTDYLLTGKAATQAEQQISDRAMLHSLTQIEQKLIRRGHPPFSRQELTVLFAAMLMDP